MGIRLQLVFACGALIAVGCGDHDTTPSAATTPPDAPAGSAASQPSAAGNSAPDSPAAGNGASATPAAMPRGNRPSNSQPSGDTAGSSAPASAGGAGAAAPSGNAGSTATKPPPSMPNDTSKPDADAIPTLFYLNNAGEVLRAAADGSERRVIVANAGTGSDGVAVDVEAGHVYWTNMGAASADDGSILRSDLDGKNVTTIVKSGGTYTPKQLKIDVMHGKLYWSDREGMRVMRANLDGSSVETLVQTGQTQADRNDASRWCVGIAVDPAAGKLYWTQKGGDNAHVGTIKRAGLDLPAGQDAASRKDVEVLFAKLPEPIDLDLDLDKHQIYWTDRGDNTVSRAPLDLPAGMDPSERSDREILVRGLSEAIGLALDPARDRMFYTALNGEVGASKLDGGMSHALLKGQGLLTGIALVALPK